MKTFFAAALPLALALAQPVCADTTLVFNEVMYHPATNEPAMEWVELHNQMAVDLDISNWSLDGGLAYQFGSNVVIKGGGYLVVAISPTDLTAATGATNVFGPFTNRLSNSGQQLLLRNNNGRLMSEVSYGTDGDWPVAPDGAGVSLAKRDPTIASKPAANWTLSQQMGGTPGRNNFPAAPTIAALAFNELSAATNADYWLELMNYGTNSLSLGGCVIVRDGVTNAEYALAAGALAPGGFLVLSDTMLGFHPVAGDRLFLLPPARTNVLDAVVVKSAPRGRAPDGNGSWLRPAALTPGASNSVVLRGEIVINEIMYDHQLLPATNGLPPQPVDEEWIELFNRSTNTVNLTGWKLGGGISYDFPNGKMLAPGTYLVVANNAPALQPLHPLADILGNFSGKLANGGDAVVLEDSAGNPACRVKYFSGRPWPGAAAGGGSSLELRDPSADSTKAEAWAASLEGRKSAWQTNSYQAVAQTVVGPEQWNDFLLGLLSDGECLVDDLSVIESPSGTPVQFLANGNFENGAVGWRLLGNHSQSRVEADPDNAANHVLHVIASGHQEDLHNHIETTYTAGRKVTNGRTYQISYRAKWLSGINLLNTRLYYDRVAKTTALPTPQLNGTPGAQNSQYATNIGPTFSQFQHQPAVPAVSQAVTVSVEAEDPQGVSNCQVWWSANGAAFSSATMAVQAGGICSGTIPGFAAGTIVQFYVRAVDGLGAVSTYPAGGPNAGALYLVNDGQANLNRGHNFRLVLSPANWALLRAMTNLMSSAFLPGTLIYDEQRPYYDLGIRLKGSQSGRVGVPANSPPSFHLEFPSDDLFRGVHPNVLLDTSGPPGLDNQQEEILVYHMANHAGGIPEVVPDMCRVIPPYQTNSSAGLAAPRFEDEFIETAFPNGGAGGMWQFELTYYPTTTNSAGYKLPSPQLITGVDITDLGADQEHYRYNFINKHHRATDDYRRLLPFARMLAMTNGPILQSQSQQLMDVDQWLRTFALVSLVGEGDWYTFGNNHNVLLYNRPEDDRMLAFLWDVEHLYYRSSSASLIGDPSNWTDLEKYYPANTRRLYAHALDLFATTFNTSYLTYWTTHYASFAPGQDYSRMLGYIPARTASVLAEINAAGGNSAFTLKTTNFITTANNLVTLTGTAPVAVQSLVVNGIAYPVIWASVSNWSLTLPVSSATNLLSLTAADLHGNVLTNYSTNLTVNYTGALPDPVGRVVINEIQYHPLLTNASYVELRNTSTNTSYDLSNWRLDGLGYTFPPGATISNGQYLLLVKDQSQFINAYNAFIPIYDYFPGSLQPDGETLTLLRSVAPTNLPASVVDRVKYSAAAPWPPVSAGVSLQLKDPAQDHFRVGNWSAAIGTPRASNSVSTTLVAFPPLWINEVQADNLTGPTNSAGQRPAWLELHNSGTKVVALTNLYLSKAYSNLAMWGFPSNAVLNPGQFQVIFCDGLTNLSTTNELHPSFSLPGGAGSLALTRLSGSQTQVLDYVDYTNLIPNRSYGSFPDAQVFDRRQFYYVTPGSTNNGTSAPLPVVINELMAGNTHTLLNPVNGKYSDWFELYNYGTNAVSLDGFYLTDSLTNQFQFAIPPGYTIPPHGFLLVWADGRPTNGTPDLHLSFKLSKTGESLALYGADGNPVDYLNYGPQTDDVSQGRFPDGAIDTYFMPAATPRTNNVLPNTVPSLASISDKYLHAGQTLWFTATATDTEIVYQSLTFSLDPGAPAGAFINPTTGQFLWATAVPATNVIVVRVTDSGIPPLSDTRSFSVIVLDRPLVTCAAPVGSILPLTFGTLPGQTYQLESKNNLEDPIWTPLGETVVGSGSTLLVHDDITGQLQRFYRLRVVP
jgi:hypothetical protein